MPNELEPREPKTIEGAARENHRTLDRADAIERIAITICSAIGLVLAAKFGPAVGEALFWFLPDKTLFQLLGGN